MDSGGDNVVAEGMAHEDVVDGFPFAFVLVAASYAVAARGLAGDVS